MLSAIVVEGSQSGEGRSFLAADPAKFWHSDDERQRGALTPIIGIAFQHL